MPQTGHIVLIADDDRLIRESLGDAFDGLGWTVRTAASGGQAIAAFAKDRLDLLVSDVDMPDMTGFQLLSWVRAQSPPPPPVLLMSARADAALSRTAVAEGAIALLSKPVEVASLSVVIRRLSL